MKVRAVIIALIIGVIVCFCIIKRQEKITFSKYYESYQVDIEPDATSYQLPLDISDIVNFNDVGQVIDLNDISDLIRQNGFAVLEPGVYSEFSSRDFDIIYITLTKSRIPAFITADTGLYLYHVLLNETLKDIEKSDISDFYFKSSDPKSQPFAVYKGDNRSFVRGLDLMALLGSNDAMNILANEGNADHERYGFPLNKLKDEINSLSHIKWQANLYWSWLYCTQVLFQELPEGYPKFVRTQAWNRRQLNTTLASWVQLQDDVVRYYIPAEQQPVAFGVEPVPPPAPIGYVEPNPFFWGRLLSLTRMTSKGLDNLKMLTPKARGRFAEFEKLLQQTLDIVSKQLTDKPLSSENRDFFEKFPYAILDRVLPGVPNKNLATILTTYASPSETNAVDGITQAVGDIDLIIVACPVSNGKTLLTIGPVLSYYEFKQTMSNRLTDEAWRTSLDSAQRPKRPEWYVPLIRQSKKNPFELTRLRSNQLESMSPYWSPDGRKIAFMGSDKERNHDIYVMSADGKNKRKLTNNPGIYLNPCWSPDGTKIAFQSGLYGKGEIYIMNANGSEHKRLTNNSTDDSVPCWSPDGKKIAFESGKYLKRDIYIMNADGSEHKRLTDDSADDSSPSWSPDGKKIAFVSLREANFDIYVMNTDGSGQKRLTNNPFYDGMPHWSPDGKKIAFVTERDGNSEIYVMNADGSKQERLTSNSSQDKKPCWSPDGKKIAFTSFIRGTPEIYIMNLDKRNK